MKITKNDLEIILAEGEGQKIELKSGWRDEYLKIIYAFVLNELLNYENYLTGLRIIKTDG
jgi:hypothetical protein